MNQTWENGKKHVEPDFHLLGPKLGHQTFFKKLASSVTRYHGQWPSCTISKKTNDPIFRKFSDRQMDQPRDNRQTSAKDNLQGWMYNLI